MVARIGVSAALLLLGGCSAETASLDGHPCAAGTCIAGYSCNPDTDLCAPEISWSCTEPGGVCPSTTQTGDPCTDEGAFVPCVDGATDCGEGCRTCTDGEWSTCWLLDCAQCTDFYRDNDSDGFGQTGDSTCTCTAVAPYDALAAGDCDDAVPTCAADCLTDVDVDSVPDCQDPCLDADSDGYGVDGPTGTCPNGVDCDDTSDLCTTVCADVDLDLVFDCRDGCLDGDGDGYGDPGGATNTCTDTDCDDALEFCTTDCTDGDSDGYCIDTDCKDNDGVCTDDCSTCPPASLALTPPGNPVSSGNTATVDIALDGYAGAAADITCVGRQWLIGPTPFIDPDLGGWATTQTDNFRTWPDDFDASACPSGSDYIRLKNGQATARIELGTALDATGFVDLEIEFVAATENDAVSTDELLVQACCGSCTPATEMTILRDDLINANACQVHTVPLPGSYDNCSSLEVLISWPDRDSRGAIDDLGVAGYLQFTAVTEESPATYASTFVAGLAGDVDVTCTWDDGVATRDGSTTVTVQ